MKLKKICLVGCIFLMLLNVAIYPVNAYDNGITKKEMILLDKIYDGQAKIYNKNSTNISNEFITKTNKLYNSRNYQEIKNVISNEEYFITELMEQVELVDSRGLHTVTGGVRTSFICNSTSVLSTIYVYAQITYDYNTGKLKSRSSAKAKFVEKGDGKSCGVNQINSWVRVYSNSVEYIPDVYIYFKDNSYQHHQGGDVFEINF